MNPIANFKLSEDPLQQARRALIRTRKLARNSKFVPIPVIGLAAAAFFQYESHWYLNPFLSLIFAIFVIGQVMAVLQMRRVQMGVGNTGKSIQILAEAGDEPDLAVLRQKLLDSAPPGHMRDLLLRWIELGLATRVLLWCGWTFLARDWLSVRTWNLNMLTLIGLGLSVSYVYSVVSTLAPGLFPPSLLGHHG